MRSDNQLKETRIINTRTNEGNNELINGTGEWDK